MQTQAVKSIAVSAIYVGDTFALNAPNTVGGITFADNTQVNLFTGSGVLPHGVNIYCHASNNIQGATVNIVWLANLSMNGHALTINNIDVTAYLAGDLSGAPQFIQLQYDNGGWRMNYTQMIVATALAAYVAPVISVAGRTGAITLSTADVSGATNINNTSDANKPVSTAQGIAISNAQTAATAVGNAAQSTANTASTNATNALSQLTALTGLIQVVAWAAGTQTIAASKNIQVVNIGAMNGNVTLNVSGLAGADTTTYSEIKVILNFTGSYTVTAGTGCQFGMLTGSASTTQVLRLIWTGTTYVQA